MVVTLAQQCATNANRGDCAQLLQRALHFVERHRHGEETLLARHAVGGLHKIHRDHEQLAIALEQALAALEHKHLAEIATMLNCVGDFLTRTMLRDCQSIQRTLTTRPPAMERG